MCLLAVLYRAVADVPILLAANREERYDRHTIAPHVQAGRPRVLCGLDGEAGGTWLGMNEHGVVVAVTNRPKGRTPIAPRSRGLLCRDLLNAASATAAKQQALDELSSGRYAGANYVCLDGAGAWAIHGGDALEAVPLTPGLHLMANRDLNDRHDRRLALARRHLEQPPTLSAQQFLDCAASVCSLGVERAEAGVSIVLRGPDRGTVSSTLLSIGAAAADCRFCYSSGPPDRTAYQDLSAELKRVLDR